LVVLFLPALAAAQEPSAYVGEPGCRVARLHPAPEEGAVKWSGKCKDGYAEGPGALTWSSDNKHKLRLEGTLARGEVAGEGTLTFKEGSYIGTFKNGVPHGQGFFKLSGQMAMYEGQVVNGRPEGAGIAVYADRSRYEGQWKAGRRHGKGTATFTLGGSYDGEWKDDKFDGKGSITYAGAGHRYEGQFADGRIAGTPAPEIAPALPYALKEAMPKTGTMIPRNLAVGPIPARASWNALTPPQQNLQRSQYPALEAGDEPPFPEQGHALLYELVGKLKGRFPNSNDPLRLYILVGADGAAKSVSTYGASDPEFIKDLSMVAMSQRFKPAICRGQPCEMIFPMRIAFRKE
jgi:hypothetical protein